MARPKRLQPTHQAATPPVETIIVGAGIAGLACARHLHDAGHPFLVISENVGGRVQRSRDGAINLGAYYVRADYTNVNRYVRLGRRIDRMAPQRHDEDSSYGLWDRRLLLHLPQAGRFLRLLIEFERHYGDFQQRCVTMGQPAAIRSDPLLLRLYHQPAQVFIDEHRLSHLARWYLMPWLLGTAFAPLHAMTAFPLLLGALPLLVPTYEFTLKTDLLIDGFADSIVEETVIGVGLAESSYVVDTSAGSMMAKRVVIATPTDRARQLLGFAGGKRPVSAHMYQIDGVLRDAYNGADIHLVAGDDSVLAIARQANGSILWCSRLHPPDFDRYLTEWRVIDHKHWNPAFHILGNDLIECEQGPNLYLIGDHNIVGLEDAYLTGLYAANQIIASTAGLEPLNRPLLALPQRA
ncbi:MAG: NAD(P)-binding protein [Acidimicrobiia bacterium]